MQVPYSQKIYETSVRLDIDMIDVYFLQARRNF